MPKLERINVILRPFCPATRPQNGAAKQTGLYRLHLWLVQTIGHSFWSFARLNRRKV